MAAHDLRVVSRTFCSSNFVVVGCKVCGWEGVMGLGYERIVLASTAECPGTKEREEAVKALLAAAEYGAFTPWDNCRSWQEAICGPLPAFRNREGVSPDVPPDWPPELIEIIGLAKAIELRDDGSWVVWTRDEIYYSHHWGHSRAPIKPPDSAVRPVQS